MWPEYDETLLAEEMITIAIQIDGKLRDTVQVKKGTPEEKIKEVVLNSEKIKRHLGGQKIKKFIYIKDRLTNIVV